MSIAAIIQTRMGSTRLPGKVMKTLIDKPVIAHVIDRIKQASSIDTIVIATTTLPHDDIIEQAANEYGVETYRGSEQDVLSRYYEAAKQYHAEHIVRITSDCPLIDPDVVQEVIHSYQSSPVDYASNTLERSYPQGLDVEVFSMQALEEAYIGAQKQEQREHVTPYMYQNPMRFRLLSCKSDQDYSSNRWTLDTEDDWKLIQTIYQNLYTSGRIFRWTETLKLIQDRPELAQLNAHVRQKKLGQ